MASRPVMSFNDHSLTAMEEVKAATAQGCHPLHQIASRLSYMDGHRDPIQLNGIPPFLEVRGLSQTDKIGERSLTVHAEVASILKASQLGHSHTLELTEPSCPNCAMLVGYAGIPNLVIDADGFDKFLYASKYGRQFRADFWMRSMAILNWFNTRVYKANGKIQPLHHHGEILGELGAEQGKAIVPVRGRSNGICGQTMAFKDRHMFNEKYPGRIEGLHVAFINAVRQGQRIDVSRPVQLSHWPRSPRPLVDGLILGVRNYAVAKEALAPVWAAELPRLGIQCRRV